MALRRKEGGVAVEGRGKGREERAERCQAVGKAGSASTGHS